VGAVPARAAADSSAVRQPVRSVLPERAARAVPRPTGPLAEAVSPLQPHDGCAVAALAALAGPGRGDERIGGGALADRVAERPRPEAVDDDDLVETGEGGVVEVAVERRERLLDTGATEIERGRDGPGPLELDCADAAASVVAAAS